jgi:hypothetical protein
MLLVENEIVEPGEAQDLDDLRVTQKRPATENVLAVGEALLETVLPIHVTPVAVDLPFRIIAAPAP